jgi:hypothetical protein
LQKNGGVYKPGAKEKLKGGFFMHCTNCGNELAEGANVCGYCGTPVNGGAILQGQPQGQPAQQQETYGQPQGSQPYNTFQQAQPYAFAQGGQQKIWEKMNLYAIICAVILAFSTLLPYVTVSIFGFSQSVSLIQGDGKIFLVFVVIAIILSIKNINIGVIVTGVLCIILMIVEMVNLGGIDSDYAEFVTKGAGYYLMILSSIGVLVSGIVKYLKDKKK